MIFFQILIWKFRLSTNVVDFFITNWTRWMKPMFTTVLYWPHRKLTGFSSSFYSFISSDSFYPFSFSDFLPIVVATSKKQGAEGNPSGLDEKKESLFLFFSPSVHSGMVMGFELVATDAESFSWNYRNPVNFDLALLKIIDFRWFLGNIGIDAICSFPIF